MEDDKDNSDRIDVKGNTNNKSDDNKDPILTKIKAQVITNNVRPYTQMIKANSGYSTLFLDRAIPTL